MDTCAGNPKGVSRLLRPLIRGGGRRGGGRPILSLGLEREGLEEMSIGTCVEELGPTNGSAVDCCAVSASDWLEFGESGRRLLRGDGVLKICDILTHGGEWGGGEVVLVRG